MRIRSFTFKVLPLVDVRIWYVAGDGEHRPGKGFAIRRAQLPDLREALTEAASKLGMLDEEPAAASAASQVQRRAVAAMERESVMGQRSGGRR